MPISEVCIMILAMIAAVSLATSLWKVMKKRFGLQNISPLIPLLDINSPNYLKTLYDREKPAIKELIENEPEDLGYYLDLVNSNTPVGVALTERRQVNKVFMDCLVEVESDFPRALTWLKSYVKSDISNQMESDWKHTGTWQENLKDQLMAKKESLERELNENINFVVKGIRITYVCLKRLLLVANSYLDLVNDSILLYAIFRGLGNGFDSTQFASQVALILLLSLIFPLLLSAITIAYQRPLVIVNHYIWSHFKGVAG